MAFPNPVNGPILPYERPWDGVSWRVTRTSDQHLANGPAAIDLGNGRSGDPVYAQAAGTVVECRPTVDGVLTIQTADHWRLVYAHMTGIPFALGAWVAAGQFVGRVGAVSTYTIAAHLHLQIGQRRFLIWTWLDPWPLLAQNEDTMSSITITRYPAPRDWATRGGSLTGRRLDPAPLFVSSTFAAGSPAHAHAEYAIEPTPAGWLPGPYQLVTDGYFAGYLLPNASIDLGPVPVTGTDADALARAYNAGRAAVLEAASRVPPMD